MMGGMGEMGGWGGWGGMGDWGGFSGWPGLGMGGLTMLLLLALLAFALFWVFKRVTDRDAERVGGPANQALEILRERYARGEVGAEQLASMRKALV